jgi:hypothetical protein
MAKQLKLPGMEDPDEQAIQLPHWIESNQIVFGQPFIIWGKPVHKDDPEELRETTRNILKAWENIRHALPWCSARYTTDPETGIPIIVAVPHHSGNEMIGSYVSQAIATVTNCLASSFAVLNMPTSSSFQLNSKVSDGHRSTQDQTEPGLSSQH